MSYARKSNTSSDVYENVCRAIMASPKYNGYSIAAGENLWESVQAAPGIKKKRVVDYCKVLENLYPADSWRLHRSCPKKAQLPLKAKHMLQHLRGRKYRVYMTFENQRFQVSSLTLAIQYVRSIVPKEAWDRVPTRLTAAQEFRRSGCCVFTYGANETVIERVSTDG